MNRQGMEQVKKILTHPKRFKGFERMCQNYLNQKINGPNFLKGLRSRFGKQNYFPILNHLQMCFENDLVRRDIQLSMQKEENTRISKTMTWLLRHRGVQEGLKINEEGFVNIEEIFNHPHIEKKNMTLDRLQQIVKDDEKQRYTLKYLEESNTWLIRANQGHNQRMKLKITMKEITECPICVHGTYRKAWELIRKSGLSRMQRNHIHFSQGHIEDQNVKSGYRPDCQLLIYVDVQKAIQDGYKFFESDNGVILCPGNEEGFLPTQYFSKVVDRKSGDEIRKN